MWNLHLVEYYAGLPFTIITMHNMLPGTFREREITFPETASGDRRMQPWAKVKTTGISEGEVFPIPVQQMR